MKGEPQELIRRVSEASEGSKELNAHIEVAVRWFEADRAGLEPQHRAKWRVASDGWVEDAHTAYAPKPHSCSLDAALALVERVLPTIPLDEPYGPREWRVFGPNRNDAGLCRAALMWPQTLAGAHLYQIGPVYAPTPALAICLALLRALEAQTDA